MWRLLIRLDADLLATILAGWRAARTCSSRQRQPQTLHTQFKTLPWAQIPIRHQTRDTGHGRRETRTTKAVTVSDVTPRHRTARQPYR